jgi:hypothetical protein
LQKSDQPDAPLALLLRTPPPENIIVRKWQLLTQPGLTFRLLGRSVFRQSLYRPRYGSSSYIGQIITPSYGQSVNIFIILNRLMMLEISRMLIIPSSWCSWERRGMCVGYW